VDQRDREKIEKIIEDRCWSDERLSGSGSRVCRAFLEMEKAAFSGNALSKMHKELIAVGIEMGGGPATVSSRFASRVLEYYSRAEGTDRPGING